MMRKKRPATDAPADETTPEPAAAEQAETPPSATEPAAPAGPDATEPAATEAPPALEAPGVEQLVAELDELRDRYLRMAAEYDNFRKRNARERLELRTRAQGELVRTLLDAVDDLGRVAHLDPAATTGADVIAGVELVERKLLRLLTTAGLERVGDTGVPFDPNQHEAIGMVPAERPEQDHTVGIVAQVGYRFGGQLLRPARVLVRIWSDAAGGADGDRAVVGD
jgi:molecular chaperone GrpE